MGYNDQIIGPCKVDEILLLTSFLNEDTKFKAQKPQLIVAFESLCSRTQIYTYPFLYCHLLYLMPLTPTKLLCVVRNFSSIMNPFFKLYFLPILLLVFLSHDYSCFPLRFHFHSKFYHFKPSSYRMRGIIGRQNIMIA